VPSVTDAATQIESYAAFINSQSLGCRLLEFVLEFIPKLVRFSDRSRLGKTVMARKHNLQLIGHLLDIQFRKPQVWPNGAESRHRSISIA
jgi:hypothetical protein